MNAEALAAGRDAIANLPPIDLAPHANDGQPCPPIATLAT